MSAQLRMHLQGREQFRASRPAAAQTNEHRWFRQQLFAHVIWTRAARTSDHLPGQAAPPKIVLNYYLVDTQWPTKATLGD